MRGVTYKGNRGLKTTFQGFFFTGRNNGGLPVVGISEDQYNTIMNNLEKEVFINSQIPYIHQKHLISTREKENERKTSN